MLQTLTCVGIGSEAAHEGLDGLYLDGNKIVDNCGPGLNVHILSASLDPLQSQAFDTSRKHDHVDLMIERLRDIDESKIICIHSSGPWERHVTDKLVKLMEKCGCKYVSGIIKLIQKDREAQLTDLGQPFAFIGKANIGFGYGEQDSVLSNQDSYGSQFASVTCVYNLTEKNPNIKEHGIILDGNIEQNTQCKLRLLNMNIIKHKRSGDSE